MFTRTVKLWRRRKYGDPNLKGAIRWAAAAGDLETLAALSLAPEFDAEASLDGFSALHAACIAGQRGTPVLCYLFLQFSIAIQQSCWYSFCFHSLRPPPDQIIIPYTL